MQDSQSRCVLIQRTNRGYLRCSNDVVPNENLCLVHVGTNYCCKKLQKGPRISTICGKKINSSEQFCHNHTPKDTKSKIVQNSLIDTTPNIPSSNAIPENRKRHPISHEFSFYSKKSCRRNDDYELQLTSAHEQNETKQMQPNMCQWENEMRNLILESCGSRGDDFQQAFYGRLKSSLKRKVCECCGEMKSSDKVWKRKPMLFKKFCRFLEDSSGKVLLYNTTGNSWSNDDGLHLVEHLICNSCWKSMSCNQTPKLSRTYFFLDDANEIPDSLQDLSRTEQQMISRMVTVQSIYSLPSGGQKSKKGAIVNLINDVCQVISSLPTPVDQCGLTLVRALCRSTHKDFIVRENKVFEALETLSQMSSDYSDIKINFGFVDFSMIEAIEMATENHDDDIEDDIGSEEISSDERYDCPSQTLCWSGHNNIDTSTTIDSLVEETLSNWTGKCESNIHVVRPPENRSIVQSWEYIRRAFLSFPFLFPSGDNIKDKHISVKKFFQHCLKFYDRRFVKSPAFVFFAYHACQSQCISALSYKCTEINQMGANIVDITDSSSLKHVVCKLTPCFNELTGSSMYWKSRRKELLSMINSITLKSKKPTLFFTLSAADSFWPELFELLDIRKHEELSYSERNKLLNDNPDLAIMLFRKRFEALLHVLTTCNSSPFGSVTDYWFRVEFQHRGSPHMHGLLWLENDNFKDVKCIDSLVQCYDLPDVSLESNLSHPSSLRPPKLDNIDHCVKDIKNCLSLQLHRCNARCSRKRNVCKFPKQLSEDTKIEEKTITHKRNNAFINNYNLFILRLWRANIDLQILVNDPISAALYTSYYSSKCEPLSSAEEISLLNKIRSRTDSLDTSRSKVLSIVHNINNSRSVSIQEALWTIMDYPMVYSSREFLCIYVPSSPVDNTVVLLSNTEVQAGRKYLMWYTHRPLELENLSFFNFFSNFHVVKATNNEPTHVMLLPYQHFRAVPLTKPVIVHPSRYIKPSIDDDQWIYQQLYLHTQWRTQDDFRGDDSASLKSRFEFYMNSPEGFCSEYQQWFQDENIISTLARASQETRADNAHFDSMEVESLFEHDPQDIDMIESSALEQQIENNLLQTCHNTAVFTPYHFATVQEYLLALNFTTTLKNTASLSSLNRPPAMSTNSGVLSLNDRQQKLHDIFKRHLTNSRNQPMQFILQGAGGTGKSSLIKALCEL
jgi:hypothetical protein